MNYSINRKLIVGIIAATLLMAASVPAAMTEEEPPTADASVGIYSKYIWRGYELSEDSLAIQPSLTISYKGFSANLWGSLDTDFYGHEPTQIRLQAFAQTSGKRLINSSPEFIEFEWFNNSSPETVL